MGILSLVKEILGPKKESGSWSSEPVEERREMLQRFAVYEASLPEPRYEVGEFLGMGCFSAYFSIKGHPRLGVKIVWNRYPEIHKEVLEAEYAKAKILMANKISIPRYVGLITVKIPEDIMKIIIRGQISHEGKRFLLQLMNKQKGMVLWGLVMEHIESDLKIVSKRKVKYAYEVEKIGVDKLGIMISDSESYHNVLYSKKKKKLYFIDFDFWIFPKKYGLKKFNWDSSIFSKDYIFPKNYYSDGYYYSDYD